MTAAAEPDRPFPWAMVIATAALGMAVCTMAYMDETNRILHQRNEQLRGENREYMRRNELLSQALATYIVNDPGDPEPRRMKLVEELTPEELERWKHAAETGDVLPRRK